MEVWNLEWAWPRGLLWRGLLPAQLPRILWRLSECLEVLLLRQLCPGKEGGGAMMKSLICRDWVSIVWSDLWDIFGWRLKRFQYHLHQSHRLPLSIRRDHGSNILCQLGGPGGSCRHPHFTKFCHGLLDHVAHGVNSINSSIPLSLDFISIHKKGDSSLKEFIKVTLD